MPQVCHELKVINRGHIGVKRNSFWKISDSFSDLDRFFDHIIAGHNRGSVCGWHIAGKDSHGCCFASAIGTEKANDFSLVGIKADVIDGAPFAIVLGKTVDLDHYCSLILG